MDDGTLGGLNPEILTYLCIVLSKNAASSGWWRGLSLHIWQCQPALHIHLKSTANTPKLTTHRLSVQFLSGGAD